MSNKNTIYIAGGIATVFFISTLVLGGLYFKEKTDNVAMQNETWQRGNQRRGVNATEQRSDNDHEYMGMGNGRQGQNEDHDCQDQLNDIPKSDLSQVEQDGLIQMREEEKLARDVYKTLYDKWDIRVFDNISRSEQRHMDMVKELLDRYSIADPVKDDTVGKFTSPELQKLYNDLVAQGSKSELDALKVGATIEDLDIYDLDELLKQTDNEDIKLVYGNLRHGSENHMKAFTRQIKNQGSSYTPQYITPDEYNRIISSSHGHMQSNGHGQANNLKGGRGARAVHSF